jgi:hypothetical protein
MPLAELISSALPGVRAFENESCCQLRHSRRLVSKCAAGAPPPLAAAARETWQGAGSSCRASPPGRRPVPYAPGAGARRRFAVSHQQHAARRVPQSGACDARDACDARGVRTGWVGGEGGCGAGTGSHLRHLHKLLEQTLRDGGEVVAHQAVVAPTRVRSSLPERGARCRDAGHLRSPPVHAHDRLHFPADALAGSFCRVRVPFEFLKRKKPRGVWAQRTAAVRKPRQQRPDRRRGAARRRLATPRARHQRHTRVPLPCQAHHPAVNARGACPPRRWPLTRRPPSRWTTQTTHPSASAWRARRGRHAWRRLSSWPRFGAARAARVGTHRRCGRCAEDAV